jgi:hypothetical protein
MIAASRIERLPARTPWPMHAALLSIYSESGRKGLRTRLGVEMTFMPSPEVGRLVVGADDALRTLVQRGLLRELGKVLDAHLAVDDGAIVAARRTLLAMDPEVVALYQRAGDRWAALASTCAKYAASAPASPALSVSSATA